VDVADLRRTLACAPARAATRSLPSTTALWAASRVGRTTATVTGPGIFSTLLPPEALPTLGSAGGWRVRQVCVHTSVPAGGCWTGGRGASLPKLEQECFFIAPIGPDGSQERSRSDGVLEFIVARAADELGLQAVRADQLAEPGQITLQVIEHVLGAKGAVADLTGRNPNVYYELAIRHTAKLPTVLICEQGEVLPFDIAQMRTIFFSHTDLRSADRCRAEIVRQLRRALEGAVDSPVAASVDLQRLQAGDTLERSVAELVTGVSDLRAQILAIRGEILPPRRPRERVTDAMAEQLLYGIDHLIDEAQQEKNAEAERRLAHLREFYQRPIDVGSLLDPEVSPSFWMEEVLTHPKGLTPTEQTKLAQLLLAERLATARHDESHVPPKGSDNQRY
jgi:hypothetical protein